MVFAAAASQDCRSELSQAKQSSPPPWRRGQAEPGKQARKRQKDQPASFAQAWVGTAIKTEMKACICHMLAWVTWP
jgi:hypothetical protein